MVLVRRGGSPGTGSVPDSRGNDWQCGVVLGGAVWCGWFGIFLGCATESRVVRRCARICRVMM